MAAQAIIDDIQVELMECGPNILESEKFHLTLWISLISNNKGSWSFNATLGQSQNKPAPNGWLAEPRHSIPITLNCHNLSQCPATDKLHTPNPINIRNSLRSGDDRIRRRLDARSQIGYDLSFLWPHQAKTHTKAQ